MKRLSDVSYRLKGQKMFQILSRAKELERQGRKIIHFELGDPDFNTPKHITDAAIDSLKKGETHYVQSSGIQELKSLAAEVTLKSRGFKPSLDQLLVTHGANCQIYYSALCTVNPGEEVIVPDPGFVSYYSILNLIGAKIVRVPLLEEEDFRLNPKKVQDAITDKTRMIIINSPSNPTGAVMTEGEIKDVYDIASKNDLYLLSDEIYARMTHKAQGNYISNIFSPSRFDSCRERVILVNGFSKSFAMTGWRLGVVTAPTDLISKMNLALETINSCVPPFIQRAGIAALEGSKEELEVMMNEYRIRRDLIVDGLNSLKGVSCKYPEGAFYAFPNITRTGMASEEFTERMLNEAGVALAPGPIFGEYGEGYVRLCYANSRENIKEGIERIRKVLG